MMKYTGLNINKQDNNNTAEYDEIYSTGLNINKQDNKNNDINV